MVADRTLSEWHCHMIVHRRFGPVCSILSSLILSCLLSGCTMSPSERLRSKVAPGDCLFIVFNSEPSSVGVRRVVSSEGELDLPLNVRLNVAGMTLHEVTHAISTRYPSCFNPSREIVVSKE
jgi:protein involved in polysaccharide export with SLBB domain